VANYLADDYMLGWLASRRGLRVAPRPLPREKNVVRERDLRSLFFHELRVGPDTPHRPAVSYFCPS